MLEIDEVVVVSNNVEYPTVAHLKGGHLITMTEYDHDERKLTIWVDDVRYVKGPGGKVFREDEPIPHQTFGVNT